MKFNYTLKEELNKRDIRIIEKEAEKLRLKEEKEREKEEKKKKLDDKKKKKEQSKSKKDGESSTTSDDTETTKEEDAKAVKIDVKPKDNNIEKRNITQDDGEVKTVYYRYTNKVRTIDILLEEEYFHFTPYNKTETRKSKRLIKRFDLYEER